MPKKEVEEMVTIIIPRDPLNPKNNAIRFQRDGKDVYVIVGKPQIVPAWVRQNAIDAHYIDE